MRVSGSDSYALLFLFFLAVVATMTFNSSMIFTYLQDSKSLKRLSIIKNNISLFRSWQIVQNMENSDDSADIFPVMGKSLAKII